MTQDSEFLFDRAHRVTSAEHQHFKTPLAQQLGTQPDATAAPEAPYPSLQLHPKILVWAKAEAQKRSIDYQAVINEVLLRQVG